MAKLFRDIVRSIAIGTDVPVEKLLESCEPLSIDNFIHILSVMKDWKHTNDAAMLKFIHIIKHIITNVDLSVYQISLETLYLVFNIPPQYYQDTYEIIFSIPNFRDALKNLSLRKANHFVSRDGNAVLTRMINDGYFPQGFSQEDLVYAALQDSHVSPVNIYTVCHIMRHCEFRPSVRTFDVLLVNSIARIEIFGGEIFLSFVRWIKMAPPEDAAVYVRGLENTCQYVKKNIPEINQRCGYVVVELLFAGAPLDIPIDDILGEAILRLDHDTVRTLLTRFKADPNGMYRRWFHTQSLIEKAPYSTSNADKLIFLDLMNAGADLSLPNKSGYCVICMAIQTYYKQYISDAIISKGIHNGPRCPGCTPHSLGRIVVRMLRAKNVKMCNQFYLSNLTRFGPQINHSKLDAQCMSNIARSSKLMNDFLQSGLINFDQLYDGECLLGYVAKCAPKLIGACFEQYHANPNGIPGPRFSPICHASNILNGDGIRAVEWLIEYGAQINGLREPPLLAALITDNVSTTRMLLRAGADISEVTKRNVKIGERAGALITKKQVQETVVLGWSHERVGFSSPLQLLTCEQVRSVLEQAVPI